MEDDDTRIDFGCWHDPDELCDRCLERIEKMREQAQAIRQRIASWYPKVR